MANSFKYKEKDYKVGDSVNVIYKIKEAGKERQQRYSGIIIKIKGQDDQNRMITVRRVSKSGIGVERIIPLSSPNLTDIKINKKSATSKAKIYFIRNLSDQEIRRKIYRTSK